MAQGMEQFMHKPGSPRRELPVALEVVITDNAVAPTDPIGVQELNHNEHFHKNVFWSPRITAGGAALYPSRGDRGLLIISDRNNPWLVEWTPYG